MDNIDSLLCWGDKVDWEIMDMRKRIDRSSLWIPFKFVLNYFLSVIAMWFMMPPLVIATMCSLRGDGPLNIFGETTDDSYGRFSKAAKASGRNQTKEG